MEVHGTLQEGLLGAHYSCFRVRASWRGLICEQAVAGNEACVCSADKNEYASRFARGG